MIEGLGSTIVTRSKRDYQIVCKQINLKIVCISSTSQQYKPVHTGTSTRIARHSPQAIKALIGLHYNTTGSTKYIQSKWSSLCHGEGQHQLHLQPILGCIPNNNNNEDKNKERGLTFQ